MNVAVLCSRGRCSLRHPDVGVPNTPPRKQMKTVTHGFDPPTGEPFMTGDAQLRRPFGFTEHSSGHIGIANTKCHGVHRGARLGQVCGGLSASQIACRSALDSADARCNHDPAAQERPADEQVDEDARAVAGVLRRQLPDEVVMRIRRNIYQSAINRRECKKPLTARRRERRESAGVSRLLGALGVNSSRTGQMGSTSRLA